MTVLIAASMKVRASKLTHRIAALKAALMMLWDHSRRSVMMASNSNRETATNLKVIQVNPSTDQTTDKATTSAHPLRMTNRNTSGEVCHRNYNQTMKKLKVSLIELEPAAVSNSSYTRLLVTVTSVITALLSVTPLKDPLKSVNHLLTGISQLVCLLKLLCRILSLPLKDVIVAHLSKKRKICAARSRLAMRVAISSSSNKVNLNSVR